MIIPDKIYQLLRKIPKGKISTYKEISAQINSKAYRAVGTLIGKNQDAPKTPCHRIVKSDGSIGGYAFGVEKKILLLESEGLKIKDGKIVNFEKHLYKFL
jgi:methylated-DNA-[protein]-cysteine S-methyltransferase